MTLYGGIDLHSNNAMISIIDAQDHVISEKRLPNDLPRIQAHLAPYRSGLDALVVESTYNWYWLVDGLVEQGYDVRLANTGAIQQYNGIKYTDDASDARYLAQLLRLGILPEGYIYPPAQRSTRDLFRRRLLLVRQRTMQHHSLQSLIARHSGVRLSCQQVKQLKSGDLKRYFRYSASLETARILHRQMAQLSQAIDQVEKRVARDCQEAPDYGVVTSIPGVGAILGKGILLETGPIERFPAAGNYVSYARCTPAPRISNGRQKGQGNRKNGNRYLGMAFVEAAHYAAIWDPTIKRFYERRQRRVHTMVAKKTLANKLARACYHMLKQREPFDVNRAFS
jgi:transposase